MNRRFFIKSGGIALASIGVSLSAPSFLERALLAQTRDRLTGGRRKTLIAIFQRGAVDGLNMVVPYGERSYYDLRPAIAISKPQAGNAEAALDLDGFFGLHPALTPLKSFWDSKRLAIVNAVGFAGQHTFPFRRAGLHGIGDAGSKGNSRWMAQSLSAKQDRSTAFALSRRLNDADNAADNAGQCPYSYDLQPR